MDDPSGQWIIGKAFAICLGVVLLWMLGRALYMAGWHDRGIHEARVRTAYAIHDAKRYPYDPNAWAGLWGTPESPARCDEQAAVEQPEVGGCGLRCTTDGDNLDGGVEAKSHTVPAPFLSASRDFGKAGSGEAGKSPDDSSHPTVDAASSGPTHAAINPDSEPDMASGGAGS